MTGLLAIQMKSIAVAVPVLWERSIAVMLAIIAVVTAPRVGCGAVRKWVSVFSK